MSKEAIERINKSIMNELAILKEDTDKLDKTMDIVNNMKDTLDEESEGFLNIGFTKETTNVVYNKDGFYILPYEQDEDCFFDIKLFTKFIKRTEWMVRNHPDYKNYIGHLKTNGLNHCMILGDLTDEHCPIEMHHGPILNLYDYCCVVTNYLLKKNNKVKTTEVAKIIMEEHRKHNIQVIMLATTVHQLIEDKNIFINIKQSHGNLENFLEKYEIGFTEGQKEVIEKYLELCNHKDTDLSDFIEVRETVKNHNNIND